MRRTADPTKFAELFWVNHLETRRKMHRKPVSTWFAFQRIAITFTCDY